MKAYYFWHQNGGKVRVLFMFLDACMCIFLSMYRNIAKEAQKREGGGKAVQSTVPISRHTPPSMAKDWPGTVPGGNLDM